MKHASLFSGIGGPEVAAEMLGWENVFHCEINPFGKAVLDYWFPNSKSYEDITKTDFKEWRGKVDVLTGGFPCQPFSYAGKRGGERTSVTSGRKCSELLKRLDRLGLSVKMLLESPLWSKEGYCLKWDAIPLCSERVTEFTDTNCDNPSPSSESAKTWRVLDTPSNRCLFRLRLSERPTEGTESSSLPLMQTPTSVMTCERPEKMRKRADRNGYKNGTKYGSLESQINYDPRFTGLLKTPSAMDAASENMKSKGISGTSGTLAQEIASGYVKKRGLMLPTPMVIQGGACPIKDGKRVYHLDKKGGGFSARLHDLAVAGMLPTPTARDEKNPSSPNGTRIQRKVKLGYTIELNDLAAMGKLPSPDSNLPKGGPNSRLSPLFTEEMMGFPSMWIAFPFLSQNGEMKALKPTETQ